MSSCSTEFFHSDVFTGDGLNHIWSGDKHVRGLIDHDDKVSKGGGVNSASGSRSHDDGNLWDHTRCHGVALEDLTVLSKGDYAFLNTCSSRIQNSN